VEIMTGRALAGAQVGKKRTDGRLFVGLDVGSTTVKCVVVEPDTFEIVWSRYERHETRQAEKIADMLGEMEQAFPDIRPQDIRTFITGSGAAPIAEHIGSRFVQEVNAVTIAVERLHPDASSVVELGGQDAKIIVFKENPETGERRVLASMNDKCASGTGATIDKCLLKVGMSRDELASLRFDSSKLHHVAAKCGVFAETDVVNLIKGGVPASEVMNSLADAIVMQNLSVLSRGNTLREKVLLLGGPNTFLPCLQDCWRLRIPETWAERGHVAPAAPAHELILAPENAQYYAACGAAIFGIEEPQDTGVYRGLEPLREFIARGRKARLGRTAGAGLLRPGEDLAAFADRYRVPAFRPPEPEPGARIRGYIGFDGGSTSSKAVLLDERGALLAKEYQISRGNPVQDAKDILGRIRDFADARGSTLEVLGFGVTGYAADVLDSALRADANIVETVAHMISATRTFGDDVDVICDIGGQDIKVLFLQNGRIKNFRLSNQCSAGNGMLLQAMADQFGVDVRDYADIAFRAEIAPRFSYGCAVFLDTDRVTFQKEGFAREELFAGLALVLPKNIWQYVVQIPRIAELGRKFVLQGGTQRNLAAVKAQVDYITERVPGAEVLVHPHCGEAGAIGAALEARRLVERRGRSVFIGLDAAIGLEYTTRTDATTRCNFCTNHCSRTFIDTRTPDGATSRYIAGFSCEKGTVESTEAVVRLSQQHKKLKARYPNLVEYEAGLVFRHFYDPAPMPEAGTPVEDVTVKRDWFGLGPIVRRRATRGFERSGEEPAARRRGLRIGIPRVLGNYTVAPFLRTYLETLGVASHNVVLSDETSEEMWLEGGKFGAIDPCFPSKVALAHLYNLIRRKAAPRPLDYIWFPCIAEVPTFVSHVLGSSSCPIVSGSPKVAFAAFTKEKDFFAEAGVEYVSDVLNFEIPALLRQQVYETWARRLDITRHESDWACAQAWRAMRLCDDELQERGRRILAEAERDDGVVLLMIGRPYHDDPGLNHGVLEEFQVLGYPVLSMRSIPRDPAFLARFFADDLRRGTIEDVFDVRDVWPENFSASSVQKVWAAKFAARHPNVAVLDLSSFKCGQDAPTYGLIDRIIAASKTPYLALHDLDANKPTGSIKLRVKTYAHALGLYRERLADSAAKRSELERSVAAKRHELVARRRAAFEAEVRSASPSTWEALEAAFEAYLEKQCAMPGGDPGTAAGVAAAEPRALPGHAGAPALAQGLVGAE
jgi:activator of 2-hydroxyglutaryl-CoA dehydratase/predicted nucleotide-binding protein (sugar kinase/HSP70/actin superfamily)